MKRGRKVIISVISDLVTDQRVNRAALTLHNNGYEVTIVGRRLRNSMPVGPRPFRVIRFNLVFEKGPLFYSEYNIRLFFFLLFSRVTILQANDLDTLLPNFLVSKIRNCTLIYDSHEYFTEVPELISRPRIRNFWLRIEEWIFPKLKSVYTVNESIAGFYKNKYRIPVQVIRNIPNKSGIVPVIPRSDWNIPTDASVFLFQGAGINIHRGAEEAIAAIRLVPGAALLFIGAGDVLDNLKSIVLAEGLGQKVFFIPKQPMSRLKSFSRMADFGLSLDKDTNLNYRFSLPNKLFDYIHSGLPVLATRLPEIERIINKYNIGLLADSLEPKSLAANMTSMINDKSRLDTWRKNLLIAADELCWEKEEIKLLRLFSDASR